MERMTLGICRGTECRVALALAHSSLLSLCIRFSLVDLKCQQARAMDALLNRLPVLVRI